MRYKSELRGFCGDFAKKVLEHGCILKESSDFVRECVNAFVSFSVSDFAAIQMEQRDKDFRY